MRGHGKAGANVVMTDVCGQGVVADICENQSERFGYRNANLFKKYFKIYRQIRVRTKFVNLLSKIVLLIDRIVLLKNVGGGCIIIALYL